MMQAAYEVERGAYETAGEASSDIKRRLTQLGIDSVTLRRVAVTSYEMEMNLIIHSMGGSMNLMVDQNNIVLSSRDRGPGIKDVEQAMREGFSTADEDARSMGFGAGMGLPNMRRNADQFDIQSVPGEGTRITITFKSA